MLLLLIYVFWYVDLIQLWMWITRITYLVIDDLVPSDFSTYHTSDAILGHILVLVEICRSPLICMIIHIYEIHVELMTCFILRWFPNGVFLESFSQAHTFLYCRDSLMELCQAHRLTYHHFSGIHVRSLYIPIELFSSHQDGPDILVDILGHIFFGYPHGRMRQFLYWGIFPLFYCGDDCFLTELLPFSLFRWGIFIHINGHDINDLCRDELDLWVLTVSLPMTL